MAAAVRREVESIMRLYAPEKLHNLDKLMHAHTGREHELLSKVRAKYGIAASEPHADAVAASAGGKARRVARNNGTRAGHYHSMASGGSSVAGGGGGRSGAGFDPTEYARKKQAQVEKAKALRAERAAAAAARSATAGGKIRSEQNDSGHSGFGGGGGGGGGGGLEDAFPARKPEPKVLSFGSRAGDGAVAPHRQPASITQARDADPLHHQSHDPISWGTAKAQYEAERSGTSPGHHGGEHGHGQQSNPYAAHTYYSAGGASSRNSAGRDTFGGGEAVIVPGEGGGIGSSLDSAFPSMRPEAVEARAALQQQKEAEEERAREEQQAEAADARRQELEAKLREAAEAQRRAEEELRVHNAFASSIRSDGHSGSAFASKPDWNMDTTISTDEQLEPDQGTILGDTGVRNNSSKLRQASTAPAANAFRSGSARGRGFSQAYDSPSSTRGNAKPKPAWDSSTDIDTLSTDEVPETASTPAVAAFPATAPQPDPVPAPVHAPPRSQSPPVPAMRSGGAAAGHGVDESESLGHVGTVGRTPPSSANRRPPSPPLPAHSRKVVSPPLPAQAGRPSSPPLPAGAAATSFRSDSPPLPAAAAATSFRSDSPPLPAAAAATSFRSDSPPLPAAAAATSFRSNSPPLPAAAAATSFRSDSPPLPGTSGGSSGDFHVHGDGAPPAAVELVPCPHCGRKFAAARLERHMATCQKVFGTKRKVFSSTKARVAGTDGAEFVKERVRKNRAARKKGQLTEEEKQRQKKNADAGKWKTKSSAFRDAMRQARMVAKAEADGIDLKELPPPQPSSGSGSAGIDLVPCPHCGRTFSQQALDRHAPRCEKIRANESWRRGVPNVPGRRH
eukprot:g1614.t1